MRCFYGAKGVHVFYYLSESALCSVFDVARLKLVRDFIQNVQMRCWFEHNVSFCELGESQHSQFNSSPLQKIVRILHGVSPILSS